MIIGSYPHGDGTFDKANDFQSVVVDGAWAMPLATAKLHAGQVAYVVPAAKGALAADSTISIPLSPHIKFGFPHGLTHLQQLRSPCS